MVAGAGNAPYYDQVVEAHGILGCVAWVIFFPLGAILIRVIPGSKSWLIHGAVMLFALCLLTANVGMGIWQSYPYTYSEYHQVIGMLLFSLAWLQPIGGFLHHFLYQKYSRRTIISFLHISVGRAIITLGMVQGGLGMLLAGDPTRSEIIAYGTVAGVIWAAYLCVAFWAEDKREKARVLAMSKGKLYDDGR